MFNKHSLIERVTMCSWLPNPVGHAGSYLRWHTVLASPTKGNFKKLAGN